jgi:hypothetical protein
MTLKTNSDAPPIVPGAPISADPGAVGVVDALGFRAAAERQRAEDLVSTLHDARARARSTAGYHSSPDTGATIRTAAFSDTMIVAARADSVRDALDGVAAVLIELVAGACKATVPLTYRGCIAVGRVLVVDDCFVGSAINEAAEWYEQVDAAAIWVTPGASQALRLGARLPSFFEWDVPLKSGPIRTFVLNPLWCESLMIAVEVSGEPLEAALDRHAEALLAPLAASANVNVVRKRQNTERLLEAAKAHVVAAYDFFAFPGR